MPTVCQVRHTLQHALSPPEDPEGRYEETRLERREAEFTDVVICPRPPCLVECRVEIQTQASLALEEGERAKVRRGDSRRLPRDTE